MKRFSNRKPIRLTNPNEMIVSDPNDIYNDDFTNINIKNKEKSIRSNGLLEFGTDRRTDEDNQIRDIKRKIEDCIKEIKNKVVLAATIELLEEKIRILKKS